MKRIRFGRDAKAAVLQAYRSAEELGHHYVGPEHLLLTLGEVKPEVLPAGCTAETLRREVINRTSNRTRRRPKGPGDQTPYTNSWRAVIRRAKQATLRDGRVRVTASDLYQALLGAERGVAIDVLLTLGVIEPPKSTWDSEARTDWNDQFEMIELTQESDETYTKQIVRQVEEALAHGKLVPGDPLPSIRNLADHLDLAPGTVARAYRQLEKAGFLETCGPQGTFVSSPWRGASPEERIEKLTEQLKNPVVTAFHLGATEEELTAALKQAMLGIFTDEREIGPESDQ